MNTLTRTSLSVSECVWLFRGVGGVLGHSDLMCPTLPRESKQTSGETQFTGVKLYTHRSSSRRHSQDCCGTIRDYLILSLPYLILSYLEEAAR